VEQPERSSPFLLTGEVAALLRCSVRSIYELTRTDRIPFRRMAGTRRCLFRADEIASWLNGAELEKTELDGGGTVVRPIEQIRTPTVLSPRN
jgi:excisionase family DNA binding protein